MRWSQSEPTSKWVSDGRFGRPAWDRADSWTLEADKPEAVFNLSSVIYRLFDFGHVTCPLSAFFIFF